VKKPFIFMDNLSLSGESDICDLDDPNRSRNESFKSIGSRKSSLNLGYVRLSPISADPFNKLHVQLHDRSLEHFFRQTHLKIVIVSSTPPFHVQYVNKAWSDACGWSAEEVLGLDCKFLQGEATNMRKIEKFMQKIDSAKFDSEVDLEIMNYKKDGTLMVNKLTCVPVEKSPGASKLGADALQCEVNLVCISELTDCYAASKPTRNNDLTEVGMPLDRREQSRAYAHLEKHAAPKVAEWAVISRKLNLPLTMQYMLETQAAAVLINSDGKIIHFNMAWAKFMNCQMKDCEGLPFSDFIHEITQSDQLDIIHRMFENGNDLDRLEYANLVLDAGAARRMKMEKEGYTQTTRGSSADTCELWPCAMSAARVSEDVRILMTLWVRDTPLAASTIMLAPQHGSTSAKLPESRVDKSACSLGKGRSFSTSSTSSMNSRGSLEAFGNGTPVSTTATASYRRWAL
jgi:PAS domain-containing protein